MKNAPDPSKSRMGSKKSHMREENLQTTPTISKHKWTNALGFELQSASNLHRDKKQKFWTSKCIKPAQGQKSKSFEVHQTCTGTKTNKKNKHFRGIVASSQVDCKVFVFLFFFVPVQVWCTLKFRAFVFFVPVQVWCTLKFKPTVCLVPVEVWYDWFFLIQGFNNSTKIWEESWI